MHNIPDVQSLTLRSVGERPTSRFVMGKGLKAPRACADRRDAGPSWAHESQVLRVPEAADITNRDVDLLSKPRTAAPACRTSLS